MNGRIYVRKDDATSSVTQQSVRLGRFACSVIIKFGVLCVYLCFNFL